MKARIVELGLTLWLAALPATLFAQSPAVPVDKPAVTTSALPITTSQQIELEAALRQRAYKQAETLLVNEINKNLSAPAAAKLLVTVAGIFFLDNDFLNAAVAYKKAEKLAPLDQRSRFTLAMAYLKLNRPTWAAPELEKLAQENPTNALYLYWLARLDYDAQKYPEAVAKLNQVIALDPKMMRAYDNLGLCYEHLSQTEAAAKNYRQAIELNRTQAQPSPWPLVNFAILLIGSNELAEAENLLREALRYEEKLPQAHYQLGQACYKQNKLPDALAALTQATKLDANYADPHYTLSRIYQKLGDKEKAQQALATFQRLKRAK